MKTNRRQFLSRSLAGGIATTIPFGASSGGENHQDAESIEETIFPIGQYSTATGIQKGTIFFARDY